MSDAVVTPNQNQPVQPPVPSAQQPQQVSRPVAAPPSVSGNREHGPVSTTSAAVSEAPQAGNDVIKHVPVEVAIPTEVKEVGVTHGSDGEPKLTEEIKKAGVTVSTAMNTSLPSRDNPLKIPLPMTYEEAVIKQKQSKMKDAVKWLAAKIMYQWRKVDPEQYK